MNMNKEYRRTPIPYPHNKTFNCRIFIGVIKIYEYQY